ncbi:MAG: gamma-glutamyltransferase [Hyphomicrobiaceae bacterium]
MRWSVEKRHRDRLGRTARNAAAQGSSCAHRMIALVTCAATLLLACAPLALAQRTTVQPEAATGFSGRALATADRAMISAANPLAVAAGLAMIDRGGSAVDAAIATQLVLNLVEPQSSGVGGGAFLLHWDAASGTLTTLDGRETAPASATPAHFIRNGQPVPWPKRVHSGLSVGTPGLVQLLAEAHARHGKLPWRVLFEPAIRLAREGFAVSPRLAILLRFQGPKRFDGAARRYFFDADGEAIAAGTVLRNLAFAATLEEIAAGGAPAFYSGRIAGEIVAAVRNAPNYPGALSREDLATYRVVERPPVCVTYRGHNVCGMGPPSSGGVTVAQTLALIEPFEVGSRPAMSIPALHLIAEAQKLAYADRDRYIADPDYVAVPDTLLDGQYVATRRSLISKRRAARLVEPGLPPGFEHAMRGADATAEADGTTHLSVIDADGNAVAMTSTIESAFGSGLWAAGFLLNNQLTDFSARPVDELGRPVANAVGPGKRPRSSMAPTIVFDATGRPVAVLGSPGGSRIILYVIKALVAMIDWRLDPQAATELVNFGSRGGPFEIEVEPGIASGTLARLWRAPPPIWYALNLRAFGHRIVPDLMTSGLHIVARDGTQLVGGADPRREGVALGR